MARISLGDVRRNPCLTALKGFRRTLPTCSLDHCSVFWEHSRCLRSVLFFPSLHAFKKCIWSLHSFALRECYKKKMKCQEVVGGSGNPGLKCRAYGRRRAHFPKVRAGFGESVFLTGPLLRSMIRGRGGMEEDPGEYLISVAFDLAFHSSSTC